MTAANAIDPRDYSIIRALGALSLADPDLELARAFLREAGAGERIHQAGKSHEAAEHMAATRTAYSLARELLGVRAQLAEYRHTLANMEAEEGQEILALRQELAQMEAARDEYVKLAHQRAGCPACDSRPGQYHNPECPAVNAFAAGRIPPAQDSAQSGPTAADFGQYSAHHGGEA